MPTTLVALDAGTTGVTCILYDESLRPLARAYREFEQRFPKPGQVEHDARAILDAVDATLEEILALPEASEVAALGVTNQRETIFAKDPAIDECLRAGIVWQDRRTAARCAELRAAGHEELVRSKTGLVLDPYFSATKIEWMLANTPGLVERAQGGGVLFCTVDALVVDHLTEQEVCATDPTNASRTMLYDIERGDWDDELLELFGVRREWLPEVRPSAGDFGTTSSYLLGREIPIRGVAGDQQAALYGQGCTAAGSAKCTFGTGSFLLLNTGQERVRSAGGLVSTLACGPGGAPAFAVEGSVFVAGALIQWMRDELGLMQDAAESEALARSVEDAGGVCIVPAFTGLGAPYWDAEARGAILGLTRGAGRGHLARAALEAIAFQNAELLELLRSESGLPVDSLLADGGASANALLMQLQADLGGCQVRVPADVEATARGAAALAGVSVGLFSEPPAPAGEVAAYAPALEAAQRAERMGAWRAAVSRVRGSGSD